MATDLLLLATNPSAPRKSPPTITNLRSMYRTKTSRHRLRSYLTQQGDPSALAWKHISLTNQIRSDNFLDRVKLMNDFVIQPLLLLLFWSCFFTAPEILWRFGMNTTVSLWNICMWTFSGTQTLLRWGVLVVAFVEYFDLSSKLWFWKHVTRLCGGPWISGPPKYEALVYADAIARITHSLHP